MHPAPWPSQVTCPGRPQKGLASVIACTVPSGHSRSRIAWGAQGSSTLSEAVTTFFTIVYNISYKCDKMHQAALAWEAAQALGHSWPLCLATMGLELSRSHQHHSIVRGLS